MKKSLLISLLIGGSLASYAAVPVKISQTERPEAVATTAVATQAVIDETRTAQLGQTIGTRADIVGKFRSDYGTYFYGMTAPGDGYIYNGSTTSVNGIPGAYTYLLVPPYTDFTYRNLTKDGSKYTWYLSAANSKEVSTDKDYNYGPFDGITQDHPFVYYYSPVLSVDGGASNGIATVPKAWHDTHVPYTDTPITFGLSAYPSSHNNGVDMVAATRIWWGASDACASDSEGNYYLSAANLASLGLDEGVFGAYGQIYEKPISPLVLEGVSGYTRANIKAGAKIKATISKMTAAGQIGEVVTTGVYEFPKDIENIQGSNSSGVTKYTIPVTVLDEFEMETPLVLDFPFVVFIEADWQDTKQFETFYQQLVAAPDLESAEDYYNSGRFGALARIDGKKNGASKHAYPYVQVGFTSGAYTTGWWMNLEGYFPYLGNFGGSTAVNDQLEGQLGDKYNLTYPTTATTYSIWVQSNYGADDILVSDENDNEVADWIKVTASDKVYQGDDSDYNYIDYSISAAALPSNVKGRQATVKLSSIGLSKEYIITQGEYDGVNSVTVETVTVKAVNGNFEVTAPASVSNVEVYNVAGQVVANVPVTAGVNTIDGSALANGVYVLKFNNGYTVKAVK